MRWLPLLALIAAGCGPITRIGDKIIGLTNPVLVGGLVLGTEAPSDDRLELALEANGVTEFTEIRLVTADALELRDIENALITDATLTFDTPDAFDLNVNPETGWYGLDHVDSPPYVPGKTWTLQAVLPDRVLPGTVEVPLPEAADITFDPAHDPKEDLVFDLSGQEFDFAFAAVYDYLGNEVWTNAPVANEDIIEFVLPGGDPVEELVIPGDAFEEETVYIVGVAGMKRAPIDGIDGLNEALTAVLAGRLTLQPVVGGSPISLNGLYLGVQPPPPPLDQLLIDADFQTEASAEVFVADLLASGEGVPNADATVDGDPMDEAEPLGRYRLEGLVYQPGDDPLIRIDTDRSGVASVFQPTLPPAVDPQLPPQHPAGQPLDVALPGGPWGAGFGVVIGPNGTTWSNLPEEGTNWEYVATQEGEVDRVAIPPEAFPAPGAYAVGVAGMEDQPDSITDANPEFSSGLAGQMTFRPLTVSP